MNFKCVKSYTKNNIIKKLYRSSCGKNWNPDNYSYICSQWVRQMSSAHTCKNQQRIVYGKDRLHHGNPPLRQA